MKILSLILGTLTLGVSLIFAGNYTIEPTHTNVSFKVKHLMLSNVQGTFTQVSGDFSFDEKTNKIKRLRGFVNTSSVNTFNKKRDKHLVSKDFFNSNKNNQAILTSIAHTGDMLITYLTINGITHITKFKVNMGGSLIDPSGNKRAGFSLSGEIDRTDFGLTWNKALEAGGLTVGEKVRLMIEIEGIQK
jgi:polyisoprenoid-binding protein YceI